jgi:hypothetical protein
MKELAKLNPRNEDYLEVKYNPENHDKQLSGYFSRQYDSSFFIDPASERLLELFKQIDEDLLKNYRDD